MQVKCLPYGGANPTMTVYYAQNGDAELTLYKEIATISTIDRKIYEFNEEGISADYWVVRFTSSDWIDLRLCSPSGLFTTGLYTEEFHQQIMDRLNCYQPVGDYQPKGNYVTTDKAGTISATKTFSSTPVLSTLKNKKVLGTDANGLIEAHSLAIDDITNLQTELDDVITKSTKQTITGTKDFDVIRRKTPYLYFNDARVPIRIKADGTLYVDLGPNLHEWEIDYVATWRVSKGWDEYEQTEVSQWVLSIDKTRFTYSNSGADASILLRNVKAGSNTSLTNCVIVGTTLRPDLDNSFEPSTSPSELDSDATEQTTGTMTVSASCLLDAE